jgi:hypothetical protein
MIQILAVVLLFSAGFAHAEVLNHHSVSRLFDGAHSPTWQDGNYAGRCFREAEPEVPVAGFLALDATPRKIILLVGPGDGDQAGMYETGDPYLMMYAREMVARDRPHTAEVCEVEDSLISTLGSLALRLRGGYGYYVVQSRDSRTGAQVVCRFVASTADEDGALSF